MTPEEFAKRAQKIYDENEGFAGESGHIDMDRLMIECLESLGYEEGCAGWRLLWIKTLYGF